MTDGVNVIAEMKIESRIKLPMDEEFTLVRLVTDASKIDRECDDEEDNDDDDDKKDDSFNERVA